MNKKFIDSVVASICQCLCKLLSSIYTIFINICNKLVYFDLIRKMILNWSRSIHFKPSVYISRPLSINKYQLYLFKYYSEYGYHTQPIFRINISKAGLVCLPISIKVHRSIHSMLNYLHDSIIYRSIYQNKSRIKNDVICNLCRGCTLQYVYFFHKMIMKWFS